MKRREVCLLKDASSYVGAPCPACLLLWAAGEGVCQELNCCSVVQSCLTLCHPKDHSTPGFPVLYHLLEFVRMMSIELVIPSNHLIICHPCLFLPSIFPGFRVFSNELTVCIRWPKYWSFNFNVSPSHEHSVLISFRAD